MPRPDAPATGIPRGLLAIWVNCLTLIAVQVAAVQNPGPENWGGHHAAFLPRALNALVVVASLALFGWVMAASSRSPWAGRHLGLRTLTLLLAAGAAFYLFRAETFLLGDGYLWVEGIRRGSYLWFNEPGILGFHFAFNRLLGSPDPGLTFAAVSILCGVVYVWLALHISRGVGGDDQICIPVFGLLTLSGVTRLFYGYVETYPVLCVLTLAYLTLGTAQLGTRKRLWAPLGLAVCVPFMHITGAALLPSAGYLLWHNSPRTHRHRMVWGLLLLAALPGLSLALFAPARDLAGTYLHYGTKFLPLDATPNHKIPYPLLSLDHLKDILQDQWLIGPFGAGFVALLLLLRVIPLRDAQPRFLLWAGIPWFIASLVYNRELGAARDWDLFASSVLPFLVLAGIGVHRVGVLTAAPKRHAVLVALVLTTSALHTLPWIFSGSQEPSATRQFATLFAPGSRTSPFARSYAFESLAEYSLARGDTTEAISHYLTAVSADSTRWRVAANVGHLLFTEGRFDDAARVLEKAARDVPSNAVIPMNLAASYRARGDRVRALEFYRRALTADPNFIEAYLSLGELLIQSDRPAEAEMELRALVTQGRATTHVYFLMGLAAERQGHLEDAIGAYARAVQFQGRERPLGAAYLNLANLFLRAGQEEQARAVLTRLLDTGPSPEAEQARRLLRRID